MEPTEGGALEAAVPTEAGPVGVGVELVLPFLGVLVILISLQLNFNWSLLSKKLNRILFTFSCFSV